MANSHSALHQQILDDVCHAWSALQQQQPLVHIMTNVVASNYVANVLLAANASPAMIDNPFEAADFTQIAAALNLNLGTPRVEQVEAMLISAKTAHELEKPWVLDPVGYGSALKWRSEIVDQLLKFRPTILRGNASEMSAIAGQVTESKGVDSTLNANEIYLHVSTLLANCQCIAISGESDYIVSRNLPIIKINGGSALQPRITATGCALGALIAAYSAVATAEIAAIAAHLHFAIAGQLAAQKHTSLGHFNIYFIDEIHQLNLESFQQFASFEIL